MDTLILQYIIIGLVFAFAVYSVFRIFRKNFSTKKFSNNKTGCDKNCGCS